jgi:GT2 family glycosyltransferase
MIDLSIIIVCFRGWDRLTKCLDSLDSFTGKNFNAEVIIVDNRSDDGMISEMEKKFPKFRYIRNEVNGGYANGCNTGNKNASGEYLLILNPDTVAFESELEKLLITARQNPAFTVLSCKQINEKGKECIVTGQFPHLFNLTGFQRAIFGRPGAGRQNQNQEISFPDWVSGSVMLMKREVFLKIGGFDEDFWMYFEDVDLCRRVKNIPGEIAYCSNITIEHNHGGSSRIDLKTASLTKTEVIISRHLYISKNKFGIDRLLIQSFLVLNNLLSGGIVAIAGMVFFFVPKLFIRALIFLRLIGYYIGSAFRFSWVSPRSVNFHKIR